MGNILLAGGVSKQKRRKVAASLQSPGGEYGHQRRPHDAPDRHHGLEWLLSWCGKTLAATRGSRDVSHAKGNPDRPHAGGTRDARELESGVYDRTALCGW